MVRDQIDPGATPELNIEPRRAAWRPYRKDKPDGEHRKEFLLIPAAIHEDSDALPDYTTDDDGIHISVGGREVYVGFLIDAPKELRNVV